MARSAATLITHPFHGMFAVGNRSVIPSRFFVTRPLLAASMVDSGAP